MNHYFVTSSIGERAYREGLRKRFGTKFKEAEFFTQRDILK